MKYRVLFLLFFWVVVGCSSSDDVTPSTDMLSKMDMAPSVDMDVRDEQADGGLSDSTLDLEDSSFDLADDAFDLEDLGGDDGYVDVSLAALPTTQMPQVAQTCADQSVVHAVPFVYDSGQITEDGRLLIWGRDHYVESIDFSNPNKNTRSILGSEVTLPTIYPWPSTPGGLVRYVSSAALTYLHTESAGNFYFDSDVIFQKRVVGVDGQSLIVVDDNQMMSVCTIDGQCATRGTLPRAMHPSLLPVVVLSGSQMIWASTDAIWQTDLQLGTTMALVNNTTVKTMVANDDWLAWVTQDNELLLRTKAASEKIYRLSRKMPSLEAEPAHAYAVHTLAIDQTILYWFDDALRVLDLTQMATISTRVFARLGEVRWWVADDCHWYAFYFSADQGQMVAERIARKRWVE